MLFQDYKGIILQRSWKGMSTTYLTQADWKQTLRAPGFARWHSHSLCCKRHPGESAGTATSHHHGLFQTRPYQPNTPGSSSAR